MHNKPVLPALLSIILLSATGSVLLPQRTSATENTAETSRIDTSKTDTSKTLRLNPILVREAADEPGKSTIGGESLQSLPNYTGSITGALKVFPDVQFSNDESSSLTAGEIRPPRVSINGAKPYENSFTIDGIGNTNTFNPSGLGAENNNAGASFNDLGVHGADQNLFYDISLVESVTAYTSNVPAEYGGFTGGLIDAELRNPRADRWHFTLSGRHTRSEWFVMRDVDEASEEPDNQPDFSTYNLNAVLEGPLTDKAALLFSASRQHSTIPLERRERDGARTYVYDDDEQFRTNENYFARFLFNPNSNLLLTFDATYAPYTEKRWRAAWADSDWEIYNDAYRFSAGADWVTGLGLLSFKAAYSENGYSRDTKTNYRYSYIDLATDDGEQYGGVGDATVEKRSVDLRVDFESRELNLLLLKAISTGVNVNAATIDMWNEAAMVDVLVKMPSRAIRTTSNYLEYSQSRSLKTLGYYAEADLAWKRLLVTPGFRLDYDDYTENLDISHRLRAEYDTFGDGTLRLISGYNRYYGTALRTYAFDRYRPFVKNQWLKQGDEWIKIADNVTGADKSYMAKGLDTPYSDEVMGGLIGSVAGFDYSVKMVHRDHRKQLMNMSEKDDDETRYWMTNDGQGSYDGFTATLTRAFDAGDWGKHAFTFGATTSKTKTFNGGFGDNVYKESNSIERVYSKVYYDGELMQRVDMPADNYNAPWVLTFTWEGSFFDDKLRLYSFNRWRDSSRGLKRDARISSETPYGTTSGSETRKSSDWLNPNGTYYYEAYVIGGIDGGFMSDLSIEMDLFASEQLSTTIILDVLNVFNSKMDTSALEDGTVRGRGYYLGLRGEF